MCHAQVDLHAVGSLSQQWKEAAEGHIKKRRNERTRNERRLSPGV